MTHVQLAGTKKTTLSTIRCGQFVGLAILHLSSRITPTLSVLQYKTKRRRCRSYVCVCAALEESATHNVHVCEVFVSLTLTNFRSSPKKFFQKLIIICPCARGLRSKALQKIAMLLSCEVRAITATPRYPVPKSERKHSMCFWSS